MSAVKIGLTSTTMERNSKMSVTIHRNEPCLNPYNYCVKYSGKVKSEVEKALEDRYNEIPPARFPERSRVVAFDGHEYYGWISFAKNV
jgi:hypothetical protein